MRTLSLWIIGSMSIALVNGCDSSEQDQAADVDSNEFMPMEQAKITETGQEWLAAVQSGGDSTLEELLSDEIAVLILNEPGLVGNHSLDVMLNFGRDTCRPKCSLEIENVQVVGNWAYASGTIISGNEYRTASFHAVWVLQKDSDNRWKIWSISIDSIDV